MTLLTKNYPRVLLQRAAMIGIISLTLGGKFAVVSAESENAYVPFPSGYGYMTDTPILNSALKNNDRAYLREHSWRMFAGIMQPQNPTDANSWPLWITWPNTQQAFADGSPQPVGVTRDSRQNKRFTQTITQINHNNAPNVDTPAPVYYVPPPVAALYPDALCQGQVSILKNGKWESITVDTVCDGSTFLNNGDIMIATESLSQEAFDDIRSQKLYLRSTLDERHSQKASVALSNRSIVTKHMYWPVKASGVTAIPVWHDQEISGTGGYVGYEYWDRLVGVSADTSLVGKEHDLSFLYGVNQHDGVSMIPTVEGRGKVFGLEHFYHRKVTQSDWDGFDDADRAILHAASYWANNKPFEVGDYLITIAMHVNTREIPSWTLQSAWWNDRPDEGAYARNRPELPNAKGPWRHYLLTDSYDVPPDAEGNWPQAVNPYIEGVIHPMETSCRNCHARAGWPTGPNAGQASYQNPDCPELLKAIVQGQGCLADITFTDFLWIIPDRAK